MTPEQKVDLINLTFGSLTIEQRLSAINCLFCDSILTTSFGEYSAVMLHLCTNANPNQRVLFMDTGFLTKETYQHKQALEQRLKLNLITKVPSVTRAELETHHDIPDVRSKTLPEFQQTKSFCKIRAKIKIEPFKQALKQLSPDVWITGIMQSEGDTRKNLPFATMQNGLVKVMLILDWTTKQCYEYCREYDLPINGGYVDICKPTKKECGIHI